MKYPVIKQTVPCCEVCKIRGTETIIYSFSLEFPSGNKNISTFICSLICLSKLFVHKAIATNSSPETYSVPIGEVLEWIVWFIDNKEDVWKEITK